MTGIQFKSINGDSSNNIFATILKIFPKHEIALKIIDSIPAGLSITTDVSCKEIRHNRVASEFLRIQPWNSFSDSAYENLPFRMFHKGEELSTDEMPIQLAVWKGQQVKDMEIEFVWDDGIRKFAIWSSSPLFNDIGKTIGAVATFEDITERKKAEEAMHLYYEEKFYKAFHQNQTMMAISRLRDGVFIDVNETMAGVYGCRREELLGKSAIELKLFANPGDRQEIVYQILNKGYVKNLEIKYKSRSGENVFVLSSISLMNIGGEQYLLTSSIDITERKKNQEALHLSEEKFSKAFHNNSTAMFLSRPIDGTIIDVNDAAADGLGYSREELISKSIFEIDCWVDLKEREDLLHQLSKNGNVINFEIKFRKRSKEIGYALGNFSYLDINNEKYVLASLIDITERKQAEAALRLSKELFYKTFNVNPLPMAIIGTRDGKIIEVNEVYCNINCITREKAIGRCISDLSNWVDLSERDKFDTAIIKDGFVNGLEVRFYEKSGQISTVLLSGALIEWQDEQCIVSIAHNITELRRYQKETSRLERLHLVGEMAPGIAHEIRNPMTTIKGFLQLLGGKDRYIQDRDYFKLMVDELDRANSIITEFLSLAKNKAVELKIQCLNKNIRTIFPMLQADTMKQDKDIRLELGEIPHIKIDTNEIKQLFLNLVRNGLEAMSPGGLLTIKTFQDGDSVVLAVKDQGKGIEPEVLEKIGTPFFTTKDNGTGLGLAVCYSIAQRHNAKIDIETGSEGTTFYVSFIT